MSQQILSKLTCAFVIFAVAGFSWAQDLEENKQCAAPGISARWKAAYCMAKNATDDYENDGVTECLIQEEKNRIKFKNACDENAYWKKKLCTVLNKDKAIEECFSDQKIIPRVVQYGVGG